MTKMAKVEYLKLKGINVEFHHKMQRNGYVRVYIDSIEGVKFTTSSADQGTASRTLDALYWSHKLQEGVK